MTGDVPARPRSDVVVVPDRLRVVPVRDTLPLPCVRTTVSVDETRWRELSADANSAGLFAFLFDGEPRGLRSVGTMGLVRDTSPALGRRVRLLVHGLLRIRTLELSQERPFAVARVAPYPARIDDAASVRLAARELRDLFVVRLLRTRGPAAARLFLDARVGDPCALAHWIAASLPLSCECLQELLELDPLSVKLARLVALLESLARDGAEGHLDAPGAA